MQRPSTMQDDATPGYRSRRFRRGHLMALALGVLGVTLTGMANEVPHWEALGVVNGQITARSTQVDITVFLSGQALFSATDLTNREPLSTLTIAQASLVSQDGSTVRIQQPVSLAQGETGQWQVPLQVRINGKVITPTVQETSLGVEITLPERAQTANTVAVYPAGAAQFTLPTGFRGDLRVELRVTGASMPTVD